ncbi:unnamed protein product [Discosporangium mesarthrocarpum]
MTSYVLVPAMASRHEGINAPAFTVLRREDCRWYTSHYCEENVLRLCKRFIEEPPSNFTLFVAFISNRNKQVPLWCQRLSGVPHEPVLWDYHVVLIAIGGHKSWIYDYDSTLPFPCEASTYIAQTFRGGTVIDSRFRQYFRVVEAKTCLDHFASDRSHMINSRGQYSAPPPRDVPLRGRKATRSHNLPDWIKMEPGTWKGNVLDLDSFEIFLRPSTVR